MAGLFLTGVKPSSSATAPWPSSMYSLKNAGGSRGSVARGAGGASLVGDFPRFLLLPRTKPYGLFFEWLNVETKALSADTRTCSIDDDDAR